LQPESEANPQTPSLRLDGRMAMVTGAGRGIGRGCAIALAKAGADLTLMARSRSELEETACEVRATGQNVQSVVCDVTDSHQVEEAVDFLEQIDVLVNNAGTNVPEPFLEVSEENLDRVLAVNVKGVFLVAQSAARRMFEHGEGGSIINVSSQMGHVGAPRRTVYCATKHAVEGLTKAMAVELAPHNVRVNSVAPTFVETPMTKPFLEDETFRENTLSQIPLGRFGRVEDVTGAVVFLASPAAGLITGASLLVDGGWTAQ
jgi:NAD(P)-dependent dehydrogenase (short-subunit alcohol dehydrogenase family)